MKGTSNQAGFTLLELLVSITILGLLGSAMASAVRFGINVWEDGTRAHSDMDVIRQVETAFRNRLDGLAHQTISTRPGQVTTAFQGTPNRLRFAAEMPQSAQPSPPHLFTISCCERTALTLSHAIYDDSLRPQSTGQAVEILSGVKAMRVRYYGPRSSGGPLLWQDAWADRPGLPFLIEVSLAPEETSTWTSTTFIVAVETAP